MTPVYQDDVDRPPPDKPRQKGKIPYAPDREATVPTMREWLSNAIGLPSEVRVETVLRAGRGEDDPTTIVLTNGIKMRCSRQKRLQQARTLQAFLVSESDGIAQAPYLSPAEVGDVYTIICRFGTAAANVDPVADLRERLATFVGFADELIGTLRLDGRYITIEAVRMRPPFNRHVALAMTNGRPETAPVLIRDQHDEKRYVRASELVAYLRYSVGWTIDESRLAAQMTELGSERFHPQAWNADRSHKTELVFYSVPGDL